MSNDACACGPGMSYVAVFFFHQSLVTSNAHAALCRANATSKPLRVVTVVVSTLYWKEKRTELTAKPVVQGKDWSTEGICSRSLNAGTYTM